MSTSAAFSTFILDQFHMLDDIKLRPMMGEYLLYYRGVLVGGLYDNRLLLKNTTSLDSYHLPQALPYPSAKQPMLFVEDVDNAEKIAELITLAYSNLKK